ncbi:MAG: NADP-dependent glyceraldehyde-3-phosphate dehydrogenase [Verrucomicrobium sp.]|nr:NADP-dependent glyceraldehyde-3-phosphate dehydrogenase [Verrucomicrobium sp.]
MTTDPIAADLAALFPAREAIPAEHRPQAAAYERLYLLDGRVRAWEGPLAEVPAAFSVREGDALVRPVVGRVPAMDEAAVLAALESCRRAWDEGRGDWPTRSVAERIAAVEKFTARMREAREEVVRLLMWEIGKTLEDSRKEFDRTVEYIGRTVEALKAMDRDYSRFAVDGGVVAQVRRAPLGVVLSMGPFNYPLNETYTTLLPALIMGNVVLVKPPRLGSLIHQPLLQAFAESFPPGVVNFIYGSGPEITPPLMQSGAVDVLAFIGSSKAATTLKKQHPRPHRLRGVLGLDAKNPALVMADADLDVAVRECVSGALSYNGQRCTALKILFVHESVAGPFLEKFSAAVAALPLGMPWEPGARITPLPGHGKAEAMAAYVRDAVERGARVVNPGGGQAAASLFRPAVLYPVAPGMKVYDVEQFGPVVPVCPYKDEEEFLAYVTASSSGQQVSLFGRDAEKIAGLIDLLANQVCRINLNAQCQRGPDTLPFAGRKDSAEGTLSISAALRSFSIRSLVAGKDDPEGRGLLQQIVAGRLSRYLRADYLG